MKFELYTSRRFYSKPCEILMGLGFSFEKYDTSIGSMVLKEFKLIQPISIEISSIEELIGLQKKVGSPIIVDDGQLEIYDDYRE